MNAERSLRFISEYEDKIAYRKLRLKAKIYVFFRVYWFVWLSTILGFLGLLHPTFFLFSVVALIGGWVRVIMWATNNSSDKHLLGLIIAKWEEEDKYKRLKAKEKEFRVQLTLKELQTERDSLSEEIMNLERSK